MKRFLLPGIVYSSLLSISYLLIGFEATVLTGIAIVLMYLSDISRRIN